MGQPKKENLRHIPQDFVEDFVQHFMDSLFVDVSCHELLGHGSGKLFIENEDGTFNWDKENVVNPLTQKQPKTWYKHNETWSSVFGDLASGWEECRAECVALYLPCYDEILETLVPGKKEAYKGILDTTWFSMVLGGIKGMEYYNTETNKWGQAHCRARFCIFKYLHKNGFVTIDYSELDGKKYFTFDMPKDQIRIEGKRIIGELLRDLQLMKAEANVKEGRIWFEKWTSLDDEYLKLREMVIANKLPRRLELQHDLTLEDGNVVYKKFEESFEGIVDSHMHHYQWDVEDVFEEYQKWKNLFRVN